MSEFAHRGTAEECFTHLLTLKFAADPIPAMSDFIGANPDTIRRKWPKKFSAIGENLLKLRYFLELMDYDVEELNRLQPAVRELGRLYTYDIVTMGEIARALAFTGENTGEQVLRVLMGRRSLVDERLAKAQAFVRQFDETLRETRARLEERRPPLAKAQPVSQPTSSAKPVHQDAKAPVIEAFALGVQMLLPLADLLLSDRFTADDRNRMREAAGTTGVFDLSNRLHALCGEKARMRAKSEGI